jgi:uncharacterized protein (TIGR00255 family)
MTGYGRAQEIVSAKDILVEIRSVNHRYFEFSARVPRAYGYLEEKLKSALNNKISRGKVEVSVSIYNTEGSDAQIEVNKSVAKGYIDALNSANEDINLENDLSLSHLLRLTDIFTVTKTVDDEETIWNLVSPIVSNAIDKFINMRETEGSKLYDDIMGRLDYIEEKVGIIEKQSPETTKKYRERLYLKLKELLEDNNIDEQRIITEAAIFSEKTAVDEETVRLRSHINQFRELLNSDEAIGRKLDFLIQEVNREVNTIGSKAQDLEITKIVVDLKSEIEKIREQIQNIE